MAFRNKISSGETTVLSARDRIEAEIDATDGQRRC
jgi:hypothetical protein